MRTRSKIDSPNPELSREVEGRRSKRLVGNIGTIICEQNIASLNKSVQSTDKGDVHNIRKRTQTKSNSNMSPSISNEQPVTNAKTNKRKRDENTTSITDMQSQHAADKHKTQYQYQLRSQSGTLSKKKQPKEKLSSNEVNFKVESEDFLKISSNFAVSHATQLRFEENIDKDVPIQRSRPVRMKKSIPLNTTENHQSKKPNLQIIRKIELKQSEKIDIGSIVLVKWPSFPYWPARILQLSNKHIEVIFFGDNNRTAKVKNDRIFDFHSNYDYIIKTLKTAQWKCVFTKAIRETEIYLQIPLESSIINVIE